MEWEISACYVLSSISNFIDLASMCRMILPLGQSVIPHQTGGIEYSDKNAINCKSKMISSL